MPVEAKVPPGKGKAIGLAVLGWLVGYLISMLSSIAFFLALHIRPHDPVSTGVMWGTAIYGIFFAVVAAVVGASFSRTFALHIGAAIAFTIAAVSMWSWYESPKGAHWSQAIAFFLMAPAAQFGSLFRRSDD
jgi:hypothetical protein